MVREYLVTMTGTVTEAIQACTFPGAARQPVGTEMGIDTCTPMGKAMAHIAVVFTELERDLIRMRTYPRSAAGQGVERRHARQVKIDAAQAVRCSPSPERPRVKASTREGEPRWQRPRSTPSPTRLS
jgi:hypothetical protein